MFEKNDKKNEQAQNAIQVFKLNNLKEFAEIQPIISNLAENGALNEEAKTNSEQVKNSFLRAIVNQNWIIMKQLDELNQNLEDLKNK